jgi:gas vesicle protein
MTARSQHDAHGFILGFMVGGIAGAGAAMLFAPRLAAELRQRVVDSATGMGDAATERYQKGTTRGLEMIAEFTHRADAVRDDVADAVSRGAQKVDRFAMDSKKRKRP